MSGGGGAFDATVRDLLKGGYTARFRATGDSMNPAIASGEYVRVEPCSGSAVRPGDVVLIDASRGLTVHRLVRVRIAVDGERWLITRGDNSLRSDPPVRESAVLGRITGVERNGAVVPVTSEPTMKRYARAFVRRLSSRLKQLRRR